MLERAGEFYVLGYQPFQDESQPLGPGELRTRTVPDDHGRGYEMLFLLEWVEFEP